MATETESHKQILFFVVLGQKYTTHKVWAKYETMRAGPLFRYFGVYMELLLIVYFEQRHEKTCLCHMRITKVQISLPICAVWSAPLLFAA